MRTSRRCHLAAASLLGATLLSTGLARATDVTEFPDNGSEQMGRGGAWIARASDPLAAFYNPAGLAGQETRLTLQSNVSFQSTCFTRVKSTRDMTNDGVMPGSQYPQVCNDVRAGIDPQLGVTFRVTDRIGVGFLPLIAPNAASSYTTYPEFYVSGNQAFASPQRYLLITSNLLLITPTIGAGFEVVDNLRLGASFQWGIAQFKFRTGSPAVNADGEKPASNDVTAELSGAEYFIPGFTLGALWSATDNVDLAGWYKWSAPISASGDVKTQANYFTKSVYNYNLSQVQNGDTSQANCGISGGPNICGSGNNASVKLNRPMEAKIGARFHQPRSGVPIEPHKRDPMSQDVFDAEVDLTWANNSAADYLQIRFPGDPKTGGTEGVIPVNGTPGNLPPNSDVKNGFHDVFGVRAGGDWNALPDQLAVRLGGFLETKGQDYQYQNLSFSGATRFGFAIGGTYRARLSSEKTSAIEFHLGLEHVFFLEENNSDPNGPGLAALAGTNCNPPPPSVGPAPTCPNGVQKFRTNWPVNLGTITNSINVINVGASYRF